MPSPQAYEGRIQFEFFGDSSSKNSAKSSGSPSFRKPVESSSSPDVKITEECSADSVACFVSKVNHASAPTDKEASGKNDTTIANIPRKKKRLDARSYRASLMPRHKMAERTDFHDNHRRGSLLSQGEMESSDSGACLIVGEDVDGWNAVKANGAAEERCLQVVEETAMASDFDERQYPVGISEKVSEEVETARRVKKRKLCTEDAHKHEKISNCDDAVPKMSPSNVMEKASTGCLGKDESTEDVLPIFEGRQQMAELGAEHFSVVSLERSSLCLDSQIPGTAFCETGIPSRDAVLDAPCRRKRTGVFPTSLNHAQQMRASYDSENESCSNSTSDKHDVDVQSRDTKEELHLSERMQMSDLPVLHDMQVAVHSQNKDSGGHFTVECSRISHQEHLPKSTIHDNYNKCARCKLSGELLCCCGKGCARSFHLSCAEPPLEEVPFGAWHCLFCAKKKIKHGVYSISEGIECIWEAREDGVQKEKQYFVKYKGLAHVHNRWISESQLRDEDPMLLDKFHKNQTKGKASHWKSEWTKPQRLLRKRLISSSNEADKCFGDNHSCEELSCYEWLVKWKGLSYEDSTWELENTPFLKVPEVEILITNYICWREKARIRSMPSYHDEDKQGSLIMTKQIHSLTSPGQENDHFSSMNKLIENWCKRRNAIIINDQERVTKVLSFILSLQSFVSRPFLIIATSSTISQWEAAFEQFAPSLNVVVYCGVKKHRKCIQNLEFYEDGGCVLFQVLLSLPSAVVEDLDILECLGWEAVIIDECQRSHVSKCFVQLSRLTTDCKLLFATTRLKDSVPEYLNFLTFLDLEGINDLHAEPSDKHTTMSILRQSLAQFFVFEKFEVSKFLEYWVPVHLSDVQLELYCQILLDNSTSLRSCSKNGSVEALRDALLSLRKCCDHPYLVDPSLQSTLASSPKVLLEVGIVASGKLQLLDKVLHELKNQGRRVIVLFQETGGPRIGDILDDYVRQQFGPDSYERIGSGVVPSKRQNSLNIFNNLECGRFIFLLENRACRSSIRLSYVDAVIMFDSDWNVSNDLRALQKIHIDSHSERLKVFRLFSCYTVEEKVLVLAKQDFTLDSNVQCITHMMCHILLMWCATYLFNKLDEFHGNKIPVGSVNDFKNDDIAEGILQEVCAHGENTQACKIFTDVQHSGTSYISTSSLPGEREIQAMTEKPFHDFWFNLLDGRVPLWKYMLDTSQRSRKKAKPFNVLGEKQEAQKKQYNEVNGSVDPITLQPWMEEEKRKSVVMDREARIMSDDISSPPSSQFDLCKMKKQPGSSDTDTVVVPDISRVVEGSVSETVGSKRLQDVQKDLYQLLKPEICRLCEALRLPEKVRHAAVMFLKYVINNHQVSGEPKTVLQAFMISLCWWAASLMRYALDHELSLSLAKQCLAFECTLEVAEFIFEKLRMLAENFSKLSGSFGESDSTSHLEAKSLKTQASDPHILEDGRIAPCNAEILENVLLDEDLPASHDINVARCSQGNSCMQCSSSANHKESMEAGHGCTAVQSHEVFVPENNNTYEVIEHIRNSEAPSSKYDAKCSSQPENCNDTVVFSHPSGAANESSEARNQHDVDTNSHYTSQMPIQVSSVVQLPHAEQLGCSGTSRLVERTVGGSSVATSLEFGYVSESSGRPSHTCSTTTVRRPQMLYVDPFQNLLSKLIREKETTKRVHDEEKRQLALECEREIDNIRKKYDGLIQDVDIKLKQRLNILEEYQIKVSMNWALASLCRQRFTDFRTSQSRQGHPTPTGHTASPRACPPVQRPCRTPDAGPRVHHSSGSFSPSLATPLCPPMVPRTNIQVGAELRAPAPHLHPYRSTLSNPSPQGFLHLPSLQLAQQPFRSLSSSYISSPSLPSFHSTDSLNSTRLQHSATHSALGQLKDMKDCYLSGIDHMPSVDQAASPGSKQAGGPYAACEGYIVCLSDDE